MKFEIPKHEKIRFRRDEISKLHDLPSAQGQEVYAKRANVVGRACRRVGRSIGVLLACLVLVAACLSFLGRSEFGSERLRQAAERQLSALFGVPMQARVGPASISLDSSRFIALQVGGVKLKTRDKGEMLSAGTVRFGVRFLPLLSGELKLGNATIEDARITPALIPAGGGGDWMAGLRDARGLIDPDRVIKAAFDAFRGAFAAFDAGATKYIRLRNVDIVLPEGTASQVIHIADLDLSGGGDALTLSGTVAAFGMNLSVDGRAARDRASGRIASLDLNIAAARPGDAAGGQDGLGAAHGLPLDSISGFTLALGGGEPVAGMGPAVLSAKLAFNGAAFDFGEDGTALAGGDIVASLTEHTGKIEIERLHIATGRSELEFHGAVGPAPDGEGGSGGPAYRYELISDGSTAAPADSPEPALPFYAKVAGFYHTASRQLAFDQIGVRTGPGELLGNGSITFADNKAPGISLSITVPHMPLQHLKQIWPWFAASGARKWVLSNVFGGDVTNGSLKFTVPTGRLGNGIPLGDDEVSGHFDIAQTRFDIAGKIPPVRDGVGSVDFKGTSVDIALSSGSVYLPSGRTVNASNGTFVLRRVHRPPVIGALEIDIAGDAAAVTELASYDPINAMRRIDFAPDDFSGDVSGHVTAQIPLSAGVPASQLPWKVDLDYSGLSLAKPIAGATVSDATGSITVEPDRALIDAKAKLNGISATLSLLEPFGDNGPKRQREIRLTLGDNDRDKLLPGLNRLLSGPVAVDIDMSDGDTKAVSADLTDAKLSIPWAGWSKGAGVPATVSFRLTTEGKVSNLSNFRLSGRTFGAAGSIRLSGDDLSEARFSSVKLNPGDDVSIDLRRSSGGYAVSVRGDSLDARPLIRRMMGKSDSDSRKGTGSSNGTSLSVDARIERLLGFNDEALGSVALTYRDAGSASGDLSVDAVTGSGAKLTVRNETSGGVRSVEVKSSDAGGLLRFLDVYDHAEGGSVKLSLSGMEDGPLTGNVVIRNFLVKNEPRLRSIVSTPSPSGDGRSLSEAVKRDIDVSTVRFERGAAEIEKGKNYLNLTNGVLRGPVIGTTFQGTVYDSNGDMDMTGTFMPAYGLNRLFAEIPIVGAILGNGRDRGLIGITYRLSGDAGKPKVEVNPVSLIAPGIFRSIFEYR